MIAGLAIILPMAALAGEKDKEKDNKKQAKSEAAGHRHGSKAASQASRGLSGTSNGRSHGGGVQRETAAHKTSGGQGYARRAVSAPDAVHQSRVSQSTARSYAPSSHVERSGRSQTQVYSDRTRYNRSNNYGGLWFPESTHRDWDRNRQYSWNNHNYRWYEGGWLIIDAGFTPYFATTVYSSRGASVSDVQIGLADHGYYRGPIDGYIGSGTRSAIARYQGDHDLMVTGSVNESLVRSLRL